MQKRKLCFAFLTLLPFLTSCLSERLTARMEYLSHRSLASYHVNTPDPYLDDPPMGQQILIRWQLTKECFLSAQPLAVKLTVRFVNNEESVKWMRLNTNSGIITYRLINEEYFLKCGIRTYKVELIGNDQVLESWHHQLWTELITFS